MKSRRRVNSTVNAPPTQEWKSSCAARLRVVVFRARLLADDLVWWRRRANQSLDASRTSELLSDSLRVTQLRAAASTQPFGGSCLDSTYHATGGHHSAVRVDVNASHRCRAKTLRRYRGTHYERGGCANTKYQHSNYEQIHQTDNDRRIRR